MLHQQQQAAVAAAAAAAAAATAGKPPHPGPHPPPPPHHHHSGLSTNEAVDHHFQMSMEFAKKVGQKSPLKKLTIVACFECAVYSHFPSHFYFSNLH